MELQSVAQEFFRYLEHERGCSAATSRAYSADVAALLRFLGEIGVAPTVEALNRDRSSPKSAVKVDGHELSLGDELG